MCNLFSYKFCSNIFLKELIEMESLKETLNEQKWNQNIPDFHYSGISTWRSSWSLKRSRHMMLPLLRLRLN